MRFTIKIPEHLRPRFGKDFSSVDAIICETNCLNQESWGDYEFEITKVNFRRRTNAKQKHAHQHSHDDGSIEQGTSELHPEANHCPTE